MKPMRAPAAPITIDTIRKHSSCLHFASCMHIFKKTMETNLDYHHLLMHRFDGTRTFPLEAATESSGRLLWMMSVLMASIVVPWLLIEFLFWLTFRHILVPRMQTLRPPGDFRIGRDRRHLVLRILERIETTCRANGQPCLPNMESYIRSWFYSPNHLKKIEKAGGEHCDAGDPSQPGQPEDTTNANGVPHDFKARKGDMDGLFGWALFGLPHDSLDDWMLVEMQRIYTTVEARYSLKFEPGTSAPEILPMRLNLDPLEPKYRPLLLYVCFALIKVLGELVLRIAGFSFHRTTSGLRYWYRPKRGGKDKHDTKVTATNESADANSNTSTESMLPLLFLHGIAPGGITAYLPMLFFLGRDGRPLLFFENPGISFGIHQSLFESPPSEQQTTAGIWEAVHAHLGSQAEVSVVGHSFGSCPITWLIHSPHAHTIRQIVLVDPVSILLSEPDVITNFLYAHKALKKRPKHTRIGVVSNELFTEHYLRRHFAWYNSELWLEDLPSSQHCKVLVCLSEYDEVLPFEKVRRELDRCALLSSNPDAVATSSVGVTPVANNVASLVKRANFDVLVWEGASHGHCVSRPLTWRQMKSVMRRQEQIIFQETSDPKKAHRHQQQSMTTRIPACGQQMESHGEKAKKKTV